jgi:hypothetical protein
VNHAPCPSPCPSPAPHAPPPLSPPSGRTGASAGVPSPISFSCTCVYIYKSLDLVPLRQLDDLVIRLVHVYVLARPRGFVVMGPEDFAASQTRDTETIRIIQRKLPEPA